ncbi:MAG TPA: DUF4340 domain-containing protein [Gemmatimonadales bacterium]|jgi:hypothetical protein|nr:DUF4340 domain-containing protein [Gemmatimonadales bacterium]
MSERTLRRIVLALAVLAALFVVVQAAEFLAWRHGDHGGGVGDAIHRLNTDTITSMSIVGPVTAPVQLRRDGAHWTANGFPADSATVTRLLRAAATATLGPLAGRTTANHAVLGVTDSFAWKLTARSAHDSVSLVLGAPGNGDPGVYVRLPGRDTVYLVYGQLRPAVVNPIAVWRDRVVLHTDTTRLATVVFTRDRQTYVMQRGSRGWQGTSTDEPAALKETAAVMAELAHLEAMGFATDATPPRGNEVRHVTALTASGDTVANVELLGSVGNDWLVRVAGDSQVYVVSAFDGDRLSPRREELLPHH